MKFTFDFPHSAAGLHGVGPGGEGTPLPAFLIDPAAKRRPPKRKARFRVLFVLEMKFSFARL